LRKRRREEEKEEAVEVEEGIFTKSKKTQRSPESKGQREAGRKGKTG